MNDDENKKSDEALPDDALENVAGGGLVDWFQGLFNCQLCHDPNKKTKQYGNIAYCDDCAKDLGLR